MKHIFTVSQINSYISRIFDSDYALRHIVLKGEVSNCRYHSSGHVYFTLKDEKSTLRCIMFAGDRAAGLRFRMENGQMVLVEGRLSVFERDGVYQMYAKEVSLSGAGELFVRFEKLKQELAEKGYFDFERKKPLPPFPERIGIVTALTGAAIEDIQSIARRRNPYVQLYLYPARVQGEGAAMEIARGIHFFDRNDVDIIIIGRGGGSMEDLWAFNERIVADALFRAHTPVISGTGHETDMTIADYCSDVRAATPSAACEMAIPDIYTVFQQFDRYKDRLDSIIRNRLQQLQNRLSGRQRILEACHPGKKLAGQAMKYKEAEYRIHILMEQKLNDRKHRLSLQAERLHALSPAGRLTGGYVFAQNKDGQPISSVGQVMGRVPFTLIFSDGEAQVQALSVTKNGKSAQKGDNNLWQG